jgi:hypothetical protein
VAFLRGIHATTTIIPIETPLRQLKGSTITQYVSHVIKKIFEVEMVDDASSYFRTGRSAAIISGYQNIDHLHRPQRITCKIPFSADLMVKSRKLSHIKYNSWAPDLQLGLDAAFALGFGICLRPGEYLYAPGPNTLDHVLLGDYAAFKWDADPLFYVVTEPLRYPTHLGVPDYFVQLPSTLKNDQWCKGGPSAIAQAPPSSLFCCVSILHQFLRRFPPSPGQPLLSGSNTLLSIDLVNSHCKSLAISENLDPSRLLPHSLRVGSVNQIESHGLHAQQIHGRWNTTAGVSAYTHAALAHARRVSPELHNDQLLPAEFLRFVYMTPVAATPSSWRSPS